MFLGHYNDEVRFNTTYLETVDDKSWSTTVNDTFFEYGPTNVKKRFVEFYT
jgi:hypothetical protein